MTMNTETNFERLTIDTNPVKLKIISDVYLVYTKRRTYAPAIDVQNVKNKLTSSIWVSAGSIANVLETQREQNNGEIIGLELWFEKEAEDRFAKYKVSEA